MMHLRRIAPFAWAIISLIFISGTTFAQGKSEEAKARHFGIGHPKNVQDLPNGKLRKGLGQLSPKARGKALGWLRNFEFPAEDVASLHVNEHGEIVYADLAVPEEPVAPDSTDAGLEGVTIDTGRTFQLHSRPGSSNIVYLDFDGHLIEGTGWTPETLQALPYDPSGNDSPATVANFTEDEKTRIYEIWHRISEDYAAFDLDVTTEEPAVFTTTTARLLFTHDSDAYGKAMPHQGAGGVAFINTFGNDTFVWRYSPTFVYYTNVSAGAAANNAEAGSHEFGHNLGLSHDGTSSGATYYEGHGSGLVSWAPIMGLPYNKNVTQWSRGEYPNANNSQDDLQTIAGKLGYAGDDHSDSTTQATALVVEPNGDILVSSPEIDPDNDLPQNKGVIDDRNDVDWFYVDIVEGGSLSLVATPAWHSFTANDGRGSNLDLEVTLMDSSLNIVISSDPENDTNALFAEALPADRYYIQIDGRGNNTLSDYSDYASMGMYFIEGYAEGAGDGGGEQPDMTPPEPGTMAWQSAPSATGTSSITMTAIEATDDSGIVEYQFTCTVGDTACENSGWQTGRTFVAQGLSPDTYYAFNVKARDGNGNENTASATAGATTDALPEPDVNESPQAVATYSPSEPVISKGKTASVTLNGTASWDPDGSIAAWSWTDNRGTVVSNAATYVIKLREGSYKYTLKVTDDQGATASAAVSFTVSKAGSDDDGGSKGKPPKKK